MRIGPIPLIAEPLGGIEPEPHSAPFEIERDLLIERLLESCTPITLISAGVGFGKTMLLDQLSRRLAAQGRPHGKITFSEEDVGLGYTRASDLINAQLGQMIGHAPVSAAKRQGRARHGGGSPCVLLLDDYHLVRSPAIDDLLRRALESLPHGSSIIATGRPTSQACGQSADPAADLRIFSEDWMQFSGEELDRLGRELPACDGQAELLARMHGWPAGCAMVSSVVAENPTLSQAMFELRSAIAVGHYFEQLLGFQLDKDAWHFVEQLSLGAGELQSIREAPVNLLCRLHSLGLVQQDGSDGRTVQLCQPFCDIVHDRFHRQRPAEYLSEAKAAATSLIDSNRWNDCCTLIGRVPRDLRKQLLEQLGGWLLDVRFGPHLFRSFGLDIDGDLENCPRLQLARAIELARDNRSLEAQWLIERLGERPGEVSDTIWRAELCITRVRISMFADKPAPQELLDELQVLQSEDLSSAPMLYAVVTAVLCDALYRVGQYPKSRDSGLRSIVLCDHYRVPYVATYVLALTALAEFRLGNLTSAAKLAERMSVHAAENLSDQTSIQDVAAIISAVMKYEEGDLESAETLLDRPLDAVLRNEGWLEIGLAGYFTAANTAIQRREHDRALDIIMSAEEVGTRLGFKRIAQIAQCRALFLLSSADRVDEATALQSQDYFPPKVRNGVESWRDYLSTSQIVASCAYDVAQGDFASAAQRIDDYCGNIGSRQDVPCYVRVMCLKLLALSGLGGSAEVIGETIRTLYFYIEKRGYVGPLLEFPQLEQAFKKCLALPGLPADVNRLASLLLERFQYAVPTDAAKRSLSPRQAQILALLSDGLSNKEIANRLALAEGTVKSYRKALYQKLDVSRRSQAVARARTSNIYH